MDWLAILYLSKQNAELFVHYINNIKDTISTASTSTAALVRANGRTYEGNYNHYVATLPSNNWEYMKSQK